MNLYRHIVFNPHLQNIQAVLKSFDDERYALAHVVPVTEYEWVAVFERWESEIDVQQDSNVV